MNLLKGVPVRYTHRPVFNSMYNTALQANILDGVDTLSVYSRLKTVTAHAQTHKRVIAQQGSYGNPNYGWHYTKPDGTNADFDTVQQVLDFHGLEYIE